MPQLHVSKYRELGFSSSSLLKLQTFLESRPDIHWMKINEDGIIEMFVDNSMMADFRACDALFMEVWLNGYVAQGRSWPLEFGGVFHKMIEYYYLSFRKPGFDLVKWATLEARAEWDKAKMEGFAGMKPYIELGGFNGFAGLLASYAGVFRADNERLRIIAVEVMFGKKKEVPLGFLNNLYGDVYLSVFLSGRLDLLVDDRDSIFPMDHKTKGSLKVDPSSSYEMDEGPTGYIFAINSILPRIANDLGLSPASIRRSCNKILMNYVSKAPTKDPLDRFKRLPIVKTTDQLEQYRRRMLVTADDILRAVVRYIELGVAKRNTQKCTFSFGNDCPFLLAHRQNSPENEKAVLDKFYIRRPIWDTEAPDLVQLPFSPNTKELTNGSSIHTDSSSE